MEISEIKKLSEKYGLSNKDIYQHKHYTIISRTGIEKIQGYEKISISYDAISVSPEFCVIKAIGLKDDFKAETFGSAKYGGKEWIPAVDGKKGRWNELGNSTTWYLAEMAEKRAMSRIVLKITGLYELGVFGEDESEDFNKKEDKPALKQSQYDAIIESKNITHISHFLNNTTMSHEWRKTLTAIVTMSTLTK